jgi:hypothetical protein
VISKFRIGKNQHGWYLTIPTWYGSFNVLEGIASFEEAVWMFDEHRRILQ